MDIRTVNEKDKKNREKRIVELFLKLQEENPTAAHTRLATVIAEQEKRRPDGVKTTMGVLKILKRVGLWKSRKLKSL